MKTRSLIGALVLLIALSGFSGCGSGGTEGNGNVLVFTLPSSIDACVASQVVMTGLNFLSEHGDQVIVRFEALEGTPFLGGTSAVVEVTGTAISNTQIDFLSPIALNSVNATITVILPGGASGSSTLGLANLIAGFASPAFAQDDGLEGLIGNVLYDSNNAGFSVLDNDFPGGCGEQDGPQPQKAAAGSAPARAIGLTVTTYDATTTNGGSVDMATNGTFTYNPPPGFEGPDTFMYTMTDGDSTDMATVFLFVNDVVWFIDNEAPAGGDGRQTGPLNSTSEMATIQTNTDTFGQADNGDYIFYFGGTRIPYPGSLTLLVGQRLVGNGVDLLVQGQNLVPAAADPVLENLSLVDGISELPALLTLADGTEVRGLTIDGTAGPGIIGLDLTGPIRIDNVDVLNTGDVAILMLGNLSGALDIGDSADGRSVNVNMVNGPGILMSAFLSSATATLRGVQVNNTNGDGMRFESLNVILEAPTVGGALAVPLVPVGGNGISYFSNGFEPFVFSVTDATVRNCGANGIDILHQSQFAAEAPGAAFIGFDELTATITNASVDTVGGDGLHVRESFGFESILLALDGCTLASTGTGEAVDIVGSGTGAILITQFNDLTVPAGNGAGGGVLVNRCTFDADPGTAGIQQVAGGTWTVGQAGTPIQGDGIRFLLPTGNFLWSQLNIDAQNGNGLLVDTQAGSTTFSFTVTASNISAPDGTPIVSN